MFSACKFTQTKTAHQMKQSHPSSIFGIIKSISIKNNNTADYSNPLQPSFSTQKSKSASLCLKHTKKDSHQMLL